MMNNVMRIIAYTAGAAFILLGLAILFTNIMPNYFPAQFKVMMGIVFFLYGAFRLVVTTFKQRRKSEDEDRE
jgi:general stress protein CsbA